MPMDASFTGMIFSRDGRSLERMASGVLILNVSLPLDLSLFTIKVKRDILYL
jgi:hypothetical protein